MTCPSGTTFSAPQALLFIILDDCRGMTERLWRTEEAANELGLHPQTLRRFTRAGLIACERVTFMEAR